MPDAVVHKIVSLVLVVLLLVQYAPLYLVGGGQGGAHTHEAGAYCLRHADGKKCPHHQPSQHQPSHKAHAMHGETSGMAMHHAEPESAKVCPCNHKRPDAAPVIAVDKVVLGSTPAVLRAASGDRHFPPAKTLIVERFAYELFHPPPSV